MTTHVTKKDQYKRGAPRVKRVMSPRVWAFLTVSLVVFGCLLQGAKAYTAEELQAAGALPEGEQRGPGFVLNMLSKLRTSILKPRENTKRGIDFGLGRGFSGNQAAKHFMGLAAAKFSGGPGKRKRGGPLLQPADRYDYAEYY